MFIHAYTHGMYKAYIHFDSAFFIVLCIRSHFIHFNHSPYMHWFSWVCTYVYVCVCEVEAHIFRVTEENVEKETGKKVEREREIWQEKKWLKWDDSYKNVCELKRATRMFIILGWDQRVNLFVFYFVHICICVFVCLSVRVLLARVQIKNIATKII